MFGRYFGGQYDSVKQAAYLDYLVNDKKHRGKLHYLVVLDHYTARLRLDILLGGSIILTDAMFFDGAFFETLFLHDKKRKDFVNFLRQLSTGGTPPIIEVRQRGNTIDETLRKMFYKKGKDSGFLFSSIAQDYLKAATSQALSLAQNSKQDFDTWNKFLSATLDYAEEDIVRDAINQKIGTLRYMQELPQNIFRKWDGTFNFSNVLNDAKAKGRFKLRRTGEPVIDSVVASIEEEIKKDFPNRSKLQDEIARKTKIFSRTPTTDAEEKLELLWGQFLQVYNRTIGIQHHCDSFDIGEVLLSKERTSTMVIEELSQSTLQALAQESWDEFGQKYNNLSSYRNKWLYEVWELENGKKVSSKDARKALDKLIKKVLREYKIKPTFQDAVELVGGGASIDIDLMNPNGISLGVSANLLNIPIQTIDLVKKQWVYKKDQSNIIEYGQKFEQGI